MHISTVSKVLLIAGSASALSLQNAMTGLFTKSAPIEEGKKPACNTLQPKEGDKYFKKAENKHRKTHISIDQSWTTSTSGSTITRKIRSHRQRVEANKRKSAHAHKAKVSASLSVSVEKKHHKKPCKPTTKPDCVAKKHSKRAYSLEKSFSAEHKRASRRMTKSVKKNRKAYSVVKVKPRKHRHHTRHITINECTESSTYAFDVERQKHKSRSISASGSRSFSASHSNVSGSVSLEKSTHKKPAKHTCKGKKFTKRSDNLLVEGKRPVKKPTKVTRKSLSQSFSASSASLSASASKSYSYSSSSDYCEVKRVPVKVCRPNKPCKIIKKCPKVSQRPTKAIKAKWIKSKKCNSSSKSSSSSSKCPSSSTSSSSTSSGSSSSSTPNTSNTSTSSTSSSSSSAVKLYSTSNTSSS